MSETKNIDVSAGIDQKADGGDTNIAAPSEVSSVAGSIKQSKVNKSREFVSELYQVLIRFYILLIDIQWSSFNCNFYFDIICYISC